MSVGHLGSQDGWLTARFGDIVRIGQGQVDPRVEPYSSMIHIGPENVESVTGRLSGLKTASELGLISGKYLFDDSAIVYSKIRPNLNKVALPGFVGICSADMYPLWTDQTVLDSGYLLQYMRSSQFVATASRCSGRTGLPKINREDLAALPVVFPLDLGCQKRIAATLATWDEAIGKTERLIDGKRATYSYLLDRLMAGADGRVVAVRELASEVSVRNLKSAVELVLSVTNRGGFELPGDRFSRRIASEDLRGYKLVCRGHFAYNPSRLNVGSIGRLDRWDIAALSPMYVVFELDHTVVDSDFFLHWLNSSWARGHISRSTQGSVRESVGFPDFGAIRMRLPHLPEQRRVAGILNLARREIDLRMQLKERYVLQRRGLEQRLLTPPDASRAAS